MTDSQIDFSRLYGVTHDLSGSPIIREPKILKISIGAPKGKALLVYTQATDTPGMVKWWIEVGVGKDAKRHQYATRAEAEKAYREFLPNAPEANYPRKLPFFTFGRPSGEGMEPDFDAIEAHGPMPTEIDVIFLSDDPFETSFAMWSATQLRCRGNGVDAQRLVSFVAEDKSATAEEKQAAALADAAGSRYVILHNSCWSNGCRFSRPVTSGNKEQPSPCKPSGDLKLQLANKIRLGGTAYFHTSGFRSITQVYSALQIFRTLTGRGDWRQGYLSGVPFRMVLRPYLTRHNGQAVKQYGVSLEFRAETVADLKQKLLEQSIQFREAMGTAPRRIAGPVDDLELIDEGDEDEASQAAMIAAEFYPDEASADVAVDAMSRNAAAATRAKTDALRKQLAEHANQAVVAPASVVATDVDTRAGWF